MVTPLRHLRDLLVQLVLDRRHPPGHRWPNRTILPEIGDIARAMRNVAQRPSCRQIRLIFNHLRKRFWRFQGFLSFGLPFRRGRLGRSRVPLRHLVVCGVKR
jgi:hypothetical protein